MSKMVAPSVLSADFGNLEKDVKMLNSSEADLIHVDIMDGRFVPNISFGFPVLDVISKHAKLPLDVHLMIVEPEKYVPDFCEKGASILSVHVEAVNHLNRVLNQIRYHGAQSGVALNPHTPISLIEDVLEITDQVILMSVNPGFGGQRFIDRTYVKLNALAELRAKHGYEFKIEIDGGVSNTNAKKLFDEGADILVAGSYVFNSDSPVETIAGLKSL